MSSQSLRSVSSYRSHKSAIQSPSVKLKVSKRDVNKAAGMSKKKNARKGRAPGVEEVDDEDEIDVVETENSERRRKKLKGGAVKICFEDLETPGSAKRAGD